MSLKDLHTLFTNDIKIVLYFSSFRYAGLGLRCMRASPRLAFKTFLLS
jgi:hypothetical protein